MAEFWKEKSLSDMNEAEWESVCDGCARCCLHKLVESEKVYYTAVACRFLAEDECRCTEYSRRTELVPNCVQLTPARAHDYGWLPKSCGYRTLAEGRDLAWWHPLVSGSKDTVHEAGISVRGKCVSDNFVHSDNPEEQIITWVEH